MWNLPGSGIEPVSPALTGGFFASEPAAEPLHLCLLAIFFLFFEVATCCSVTQLCLTLWPHGLLLLFEVTTCCSVTQSCLTLGDSMDCSMPGFPVLHHLSEVAQIHVHRVGDAIQLSHPLSSPSSALHPSQHQGLFQ